MIKKCLLLFFYCVVLGSQKKILIVDNGCSFVPYICRCLKEESVDYNVVSPCSTDKDVSEILSHNFSGIILSGGPARLSRQVTFKAIIFNCALILQANVPVLGICLGHQILAMLFGGKIQSFSQMTKKDEKIQFLDYNEPLFKGLKSFEYMRESHHDCIVSVPPNFKLLATSASCQIEAIKHDELPIYGVQFHPEVSGKVGRKFIQNFLERSWRNSAASE
jgi:GMP synthase (glutamine-hydrolysing)